MGWGRRKKGHLPVLSQIVVGDVLVDVVRKDVKHVRLSITPPAGRVRISAPTHVPDETIRQLTLERLKWIRAQQSKVRERYRAERCEYVGGERIAVWGRLLTLEVAEEATAPGVRIKDDVLCLRVKPGADREKREAVIAGWHRRNLMLAAGALVEAYEPLLGVKVAGLQVRRMRTRWGSCTPSAGTIRLNLELAQRAPACLTYVLVHEMAHLLVSNHGPLFRAIMDEALPDWRETRALLNGVALTD